VINLVKRDGSYDPQEVRTLKLIAEGPELTTFEDESGRHHFFDKDGYYDGWAEPFSKEPQKP
jgi:hypothetical protein